MLIENNILKRIDPDDIIDGVFTAPDEVLYIGDNLCYDYDLVGIYLPNVIRIGSNFLYDNLRLRYFSAPKVEEIGYNFLYNNRDIKEMNIPNVKKIDYNFMADNDTLEKLDIPNIEEIGGCFLYSNSKFKYNHLIIKSLMGIMFVSRLEKDKKKYIRKLNIEKLLC